jgi:hypothetical protein
MNFKLLAGLPALALAVLLDGCTSPSSLPMTYQIPIGISQVSNAYGVQNLTVNATKDLAVQAGAVLYYQVVSPVNLTFYVFDKTGPGPGGTLLGQLQGTTFTSQVTPQSSTLEFVFSAAQMGTGGTVQFTVSDRPITPVAGAVIMQTTQVTTQAPTTQTTTTQTTTVAPAMPAPGPQE